MPNERISDFYSHYCVPQESHQNSGWIVTPSDFELEFDCESLEFFRKQFNTDKCFFCKKKIEGIKRKTIKTEKNKIYVCSNCEHLFQTIRNEYKSKNGKTIGEIISFIVLYGEE